MKRIAIFLIIILSVAVLILAEFESGDVMRLHVKANSDSVDDLSIKKEVAKKVNEFLEENCNEESLSETVAFLKDNMEKLKKLIKDTLSEHGVKYEAEIAITKTDFPSRSYGNVFFGSDKYNALVITLGKGEGDNWWCVLYPRLCYGKEINGHKIIYRSRIIDAYKKIVKEFE